MDASFRRQTNVFTGCITHSTYFIDKEGRVSAYGSNYGGQLGVGHKNRCFLPTEVKGLDGIRIRQVSSSYNHAVFLSEAGSNVFVCGSNDKFQLGIRSTHGLSVPTLLSFFCTKRISSVCAGGNSTYCLSEDGVLYSFGSNEDGQLGAGYPVARDGTWIPQQVILPENVKIESVSVGWGHVAVLGREGSVYTFGSNRFEQIGRTDETDLPVRVNFLGDKRVKMVLCGSASVFMLVELNEIYYFGVHGDAYLGRGYMDPLRKCQRILCFVESPVSLLSVGGLHSIGIVRRSDGKPEMVAYGSNLLCQLPFGDAVENKWPMVVDVRSLGIGKISDVKCGSAHTLIITEEGNCYGIGCKEAFGREEHVAKPLLIAKNVIMDGGL